MLDFLIFGALVVALAALWGPARKSGWGRAGVSALYLTIAFMFFYGAIPSTIITWSDDWKIILDNKAGTGLGPRLRDILIVGYYGVLVPITFIGASLWQQMRPVNADADEAKRDAGGYR
jgi:cytochrome c biogenesis factor